jgi:hypothetical protein
MSGADFWIWRNASIDSDQLRDNSRTAFVLRAADDGIKYTIFMANLPAKV